jgi:hypothetical protein
MRYNRTRLVEWLSVRARNVLSLENPFLKLIDKCVKILLTKIAQVLFRFQLTCSSFIHVILSAAKNLAPQFNTKFFVHVGHY